MLKPNTDEKYPFSNGLDAYLWHRLSQSNNKTPLTPKEK